MPHLEDKRASWLFVLAYLSTEISRILSLGENLRSQSRKHSICSLFVLTAVIQKQLRY